MISSDMRTLSRATLLVMLAISPLGTAALAGELAGITMPDTLKAGAKTLTLNGLGLRKKAVFKVYVGGLYLELPSKDAGAILASDRAKAIRMHFLRDLTKAQLVEAFQEGFEANAKEQAAQKGRFRQDARAGSRREGRQHTNVHLPAGERHNAASRERGVGCLRGEGVRGRGLLDLAGSQAAL